LCSDSHRSPQTGSKPSDPSCHDREKVQLPQFLPSICRPESPDEASAEDPAAFNAHSPSGTGSGLVQHVFRSPARIQQPIPAERLCGAPPSEKRSTLSRIKLGDRGRHRSCRRHRTPLAAVSVESQGKVQDNRTRRPSWESPRRCRSGRATGSLRPLKRSDLIHASSIYRMTTALSASNTGGHRHVSPSGPTACTPPQPPSSGMEENGQQRI
jgi:hypothetical protein